MRLFKNKKRFLQNLAIGSMTFFSILSIYAATLAWLSANRNVKNSGISIKSKLNEGKLKKVSYYAFDTFEDNTYKYNKNSLGSFTYNWATNEMNPGVFNVDPTWEVPIYDSFYKYNSMLMIFELNNEYTFTRDGEFYIKGITTVGGGTISTNYDPNDTEHKNPYSSGGGYLGARLENGSPFYNLDEITSPSSGSPELHDDYPESILMKQLIVDGTRIDYFALSSVARFQTKIFTSSEYDALMAGDSINIQADSSLKMGNSFTTVNNETDKYYFNQKPNIYEAEAGETVKYVGIIMDYSPDAIGHIYSTYLGDSYMDRVGSTLYFSCDWSLEVY